MTIKKGIGPIEVCVYWIINIFTFGGLWLIKISVKKALQEMFE